MRIDDSIESQRHAKLKANEDEPSPMIDRWTRNPLDVLELPCSARPRI